ncbi:MAG: hypothetical protein HZB25_00970 [Candidatus Eisenbacteria bacterium]|nr:hypothetical protein [Candidatus Eisenbacteria bacterium]
MRKILHPGPTATLMTTAVLLTLCLAVQDAAARSRKDGPARKSGPAQKADLRPSGAPVVSGLVVAVDPLSGRQSLPTLEQLAELSAAEKHMLSRSDAGLVQHRLANGAVVLDLDGRFQEFTFVRLGPGGGRHFSCMDDAPVLRRALKPADPARDASGLEVK